MEITEVKVFLVGEEKLKAFVSIVLDRCFMINDIKVIQGREGLFISMPSRRKKNGDFKDVAHPLNNQTRTWLANRVLSEYRAQCQSQSSQSQSSQPQSSQPQSNGDRPSETLLQDKIGRIEESLAAASPGTSPGLSERLEEVRQEHLSDDFWSVDPARVGRRA